MLDPVGEPDHAQRGAGQRAIPAGVPQAAAEQARERLIHHMERINLAAKRLLA